MSPPKVIGHVRFCTHWSAFRLLGTCCVPASTRALAGRELSCGTWLPCLPVCGRRTLSHLCRSSQYGMVAGASRENGMETPMHENPEWEKARQALASISKAGAASSSKASSSGPVASAQVRRTGTAGRGGAVAQGGKDAGFQRMACLRGL